MRHTDSDDMGTGFWADVRAAAVLTLATGCVWVLLCGAVSLAEWVAR